MATDVRCPICGNQSVYAKEVDSDHTGGGSSRRGRATFACRHGCDSRDQVEWAGHVDQIRAEWKVVNGI